MRVQDVSRKADKKISGLIFVISGPSGSGKTTLLSRLLRKNSLRRKLARSVSFTTRPKRSKEVDGRDYFFVSPQRFQELRKAKKFLEWTRYLGYYYATSRDFVESRHKAGKHVILCLDLKGALAFKRLYAKNIVTIFIAPPSIGALDERIRKRCHRTKQDEIRQRLALAKGELLAARKYDYSLVNRDLEQVSNQLSNIILKEIYPDS